MTEHALATDQRVLEDRAFRVEILPRVSRTFALSIEALPESLRDAVRVAYLMCRIVDTIEDDARLPGPAREGLFDAFDALLLNNRRDPVGFEALAARHDLGGDTPDGLLCREAGRTIRAFRDLDPWKREAIRPWVLEMSRGMRATTRRWREEGRLRLRDLPDLEQYCYYVAGTVGNLLTALFEGTVTHLSASARATAREQAVSFGLGLQLVNILKDVAEDAERGVCYLPEDLAAARGVDLDAILDPDLRDAGLALVRDVSARARHHLRNAIEYTLAWPAPDAIHVRLFCAVPLSLAVRTLDEVERGDDVLRRDRKPKVERETVAAVLAEVGAAVGDDDALRVVLGAA